MLARTASRSPTHSMKDKILIIGAGPAGLACAMELCRSGESATIIERDAKIGGLAKTLTFTEGEDVFHTDVGPHRFFSKNEYLYAFIEDLLHDEWRKVPRVTRQYIEGKFYDYPVAPLQVLKNIGLMKAMKMAAGYAHALLQFGLLRKEVVNFEDYVVSNFGRTLAEFSMINYTEKIWGIPASTIHPDWARQRIQGLSLISVVKNALRPSKSGPKSLVDEFFYPRMGTGQIYEQIGTRLQEVGSTIQCNSHPTAIRHDGKRILEIDLSVNGEQQTVRPEWVVESVPITHFLSLLDPPPPPEVMQACNALQWRSQVYLFLTLDKPQVTTDNWIYFPNKDIPFGRVSEMKNFSDYMSPPDKTSLFIEFFAFETDAVWSMSKEELVELVLPYFEDFGFFTREELRESYVFKRSYVYPVYDMDYPGNLEILKAYLDQLENLYYIGRPGRFKYTNQDHSLEMGIVTGQNLLNGKRSDLDSIGAENEYFESGRIYEKRI